MLICVAALLLKLIVPTGYMIASDHGRLAITICSGVTPPPVMPKAAMHGMHAMHGSMADHGSSKEHGKPEMPCAFAGLSAASLGAVDPIQLAAQIAFIVAVGLAGVALPVGARPAFLRPPVRGPPARL